MQLAVTCLKYLQAEAGYIDLTPDLHHSAVEVRQAYTPSDFPAGAFLSGYIADENQRKDQDSESRSAEQDRTSLIHGERPSTKYRIINRDGDEINQYTKKVLPTSRNLVALS